MVGVTLGSFLEDMPGWAKMRDYANKRLEELGWEMSFFIRTATKEEMKNVFEEAGQVFRRKEDDGTIELVVGPRERFGLDEMQRIFEKHGIWTDAATSMTLWALQVDPSDFEGFAEANIIEPMY